MSSNVNKVVLVKDINPEIDEEYVPFSDNSYPTIMKTSNIHSEFILKANAGSVNTRKFT